MLEASDLVSARAGRPVHAPVAFALNPGEVLLLRGANGSGKSTLLRTLGGFLTPWAGTVTWHGRPCDESAFTAARHWLSHANGLKSGLTVRENLRLAQALAGSWNEAREPADPFVLEPMLDIAVGHLSQGQRRRAALARLLHPRRPIWLLDEPGVGLDRANAERLTGLIAQHAQNGGIVVVASHGDVRLDAPLVLDL